MLAATIEESLQWPYMLSYIAVNVPPLEDGDYAYTGWSSAERATWLIMNATTSALIQVCPHRWAIQAYHSPTTDHTYTIPDFAVPLETGRTTGILTPR